MRVHPASCSFAVQYPDARVRTRPRTPRVDAAPRRRRADADEQRFIVSSVGLPVASSIHSGGWLSVDFSTHGSLLRIPLQLLVQSRVSENSDPAQSTP